MKENRLKHVRDDLGSISQARLAEFIDISVNKIRDAESGKTKISTEIATAVEKRFGYNLRWLLTGEGPPKGTEDEEESKLGVVSETPQLWRVDKKPMRQATSHNFSPEQWEVINLLMHYGNEALFEDLKARLLKIKHAMEE